VFGADPVFGLGSRRALEGSLSRGAVIACPAVWAEIVPYFDSAQAAADAMAAAEVSFSAFDEGGSLRAGSAWREYRRSGGSRERVIADFLIGAHAGVFADRLLTRDRGFYRRYFRELDVLDPTR
jgi:predicted nucleic acid-binding protein